MEKPVLTVKHSSVGAVSAFLLGQLAVVFVAVIGLIIANVCGFSNQTFYAFLENGFGYLVTSITLNSVFVLTYLFTCKGKENKIIEKSNGKKLSFYVLLAIASFFCLYPIVASFQMLIGRFNVFPPKINLDGANFVYAIFSMAILPAICEELLFRGLIFKGLQRNGKVFAITISSVMFSLFHTSIHQLIYPMLFGLLLGGIMHKENNIIYCIAAHLTNNLLSLILMKFNISLTVSSWWYVLLAFALVSTYIAFIVWFIKKMGKTNKIALSKTEKIYLIGAMIILTLLWLIANLSL